MTTTTRTPVVFIHRAVSLTDKEFRYAFGNAIPPEESDAPGHGLTIDHGWRAVADECPAWLAKQGV